jgi:signal peptidase I
MRDLFTSVLIVLLVALEITFWRVNPMHIPATFVPARAFGVQVFQQMDSSMEPIVPAGAHVPVVSWPYWRHEPQVGDIIAFQYPTNPTVADLKRIVAAGGSTVEIRGGATYVDGKRIPEPYLAPGIRLARDSLELSATRIPPGSYFVMGDNRDQSRDSRDYGVITRDRIIGKRWIPSGE